MRRACGRVRTLSRRLRGVLLDKDGTLIDYWRTWVPINREAALFAASGDAALARELLAFGGHDPDTDRITPGSVLAAGSLDDIAQAFATCLGERTPPGLAAGIDAVFRDGGARHSVLVADAVRTLDRLAAMGLALGVATNDTAGGLAASLGRHEGLIGRFRFLAGCDSGHGAKPEPGMVLAFAAATGLAPDAIAVVGDAVHDLEMGRRAGAGLCIGVLGGTSPRAALAPHADLVIEHLADLPAVLIGSRPQ